MILIDSKDREHIEKIAEAFAESFLAQPGSLSSCMEYEEAVIYFRMTLYEYARAKTLYALSEKEEAYIVYHHKDKGIPMFRDLLLFFRYFRHIRIETLQKMMLIRRGWTDYTIAHLNTPDYIDVALVAVKKEYQGQGYLRKLMAAPFAEADKNHIPCILDTDSEHKAVRYAHVGMRIERDAVLASGLHLYTMIYEPAERKTK
jgi:GNAT superfamily N-acetyltransferase